MWSAKLFTSKYGTNHSIYLIKLITRYCYPEGNFDRNQLPDCSISLIDELQTDPRNGIKVGDVTKDRLEDVFGVKETDPIPEEQLDLSTYQVYPQHFLGKFLLSYLRSSLVWWWTQTIPSIYAIAV